jgi:hypothetical protein
MNLLSASHRWLRRLAVVSAVTGSAVAVAGQSSAASLSFSDSAATQVPNWQDTLSIAQFDASLGTLTGVTLTFTGHNTGTLAAENLATAGTLNLTGSASYSLNSAVWNLTGSATAAHVFNAAGFDGSVDYGGASGATFTNATGEYVNSITLTSGLEAFIGSGQLAFGVNVVGGSSYTGTGAAVVTFAQSADAELNVTYHYTTPSAVTTVPEPGTHALFWVGLVVVGWVNRLQRRRLS